MGRRAYKSELPSHTPRQPTYIELITINEWEKIFLQYSREERSFMCPVHPEHAEEFFSSPYRNAQIFKIEWELSDGLEKLRDAIG